MRIAYYSNTFGSLPFSARRSSRETIDMVGLNLGNLAFSNASHRFFEGEKFAFDVRSKPEAIRQNADVIVFSVANWLNSSTDLGWLAKMVETIDRPVVLMGIGAQTGLEGSPLVLSDGTRDFVRACAKRTSQILVRGPYTASVCQAMGVANVRAVGCPSLLTERDPTLGRLIASRWEFATDRMAFHTLEIQDRLAATEQHLVELAKMQEGSAFVVQHQYELVDVAASDGRNLSDEERKRLLWFCKFLAPKAPPEETAKWLRQHLFFFDSVDAWRRFLRNYSGSINTRIHGTLMTLSAGLPGVCLYHDSRTKELAETMLVPALMHTDVVASRMTARDIFDAVSIDGTAFDENRRCAANVYREVLAEIGLQPSDHLTALAEGSA